MGKNSVFWKWMVSYMVVMLVFLFVQQHHLLAGKADSGAESGNGE